MCEHAYLALLQTSWHHATALPLLDGPSVFSISSLILLFSHSKHIFSQTLIWWLETLLVEKVRTKIYSTVYAYLCVCVYMCRKNVMCLHVYWFSVRLHNTQRAAICFTPARVLARPNPLYCLCVHVHVHGCVCGCAHTCVCA